MYFSNISKLYCYSENIFLFWDYAILNFPSKFCDLLPQQYTPPPTPFPHTTTTKKKISDPPCQANTFLKITPPKKLEGVAYYGD